jgi:multiple sugar transport system substrate-binding protein
VPAAPEATTAAPAEPAAPAVFDWKKYSGTEIRVIALKFPYTELVKERLPEFEELTGIKVNLEELPEDQWRQKVKVELTAANPDLDAFMSYYGQEGRQFSESGFYVDLKPLMDDPALTSPDYNWDGFSSIVKQAAVIDGKIPIAPDRGSSPPVLYYRTDLFEQFKLEPPKTWDDVWNAAKTIHEGTNGETFGIVLRGKGAAATSMFAPVLYDMGGTWFNRETGNVTFNTPEALKAFQWWGDILRNYGPPGSVNNHFAEVVSIYSQGRAAMVFDDIAFYPQFNDASKSTIVGKFAIAPIPTGPASDTWRTLPPYLQGVNGYAISNFSTKKEAAWYFVQFMTDAEMSKRFAKKGGLAARPSAFDDPEVLEALPKDFLETIKINSQITYPGAAPLSISNISKARDFIGNVIVTAIQGGDVKAAQEQAFKDVSALLEEERAAAK